MSDDDFWTKLALSEADEIEPFREVILTSDTDHTAACPYCARNLLIMPEANRLLHEHPECDAFAALANAMGQELGEPAYADAPGSLVAPGEPVDLKMRKLISPYLPQPPCQGCGSTIEDCGPALWLQGKKCCPDCTHGMDGPNAEYEPDDDGPVES